MQSGPIICMVSFLLLATLMDEITSKYVINAMQFQYVSIDFSQVCLLTEVFFAANFFLQFLIMSALVGIPLFTFHVSLGQLLASGTMDMWKISPVFQVQSYSIVLTVLIFEQKMSSTLNLKVVENFTCLTNNFSLTSK